VRNVIPMLAAQDDVRVTLAAGPKIGRELCHFANVDVLGLEISPVRRPWFEQSKLSGLIRRSGADVLLSTGNFALRKSPVPQILLSRNSIYTSPDYFRDLRRRHEYRAWADTYIRSMVAKRSIHWAEVTVAPSEAFAAELRNWAGVDVVAIHHGFDQAAFVRDATPLPAEVEAKLRSADGALKVLFVSHYNYYRNFETLIRGLALIRGLVTFYGICAVGAVANIGVADYVFANRGIVWLAGVAGAVIGVVWNFTVSNYLTWRRRATR